MVSIILGRYYHDYGATRLKCIMHISSNPLVGKPVVPRIPRENLRSIRHTEKSVHFLPIFKIVVEVVLQVYVQLGKHVLGQFSVMASPIDLKMFLGK